MLTKTTLRLAILIGVFALPYPVPSYAQDCRAVSGRSVESVVVPFLSANDPFGRVVGRTEGSINAVYTAVLTSVAPGPGGPPSWTASSGTQNRTTNRAASLTGWKSVAISPANRPTTTSRKRP